MQEEWRKVFGSGGVYFVSNLGRVKNIKKDKILNQPKNTKGYYVVSIKINGKHKIYPVHQLVWEHFGNGQKSSYKTHIDHIDENRLNNRIDNLQMITARENIVKSRKLKPSTSKYTGVSFFKITGKWRSQICKDGKKIYLGYYNTEEEAKDAYDRALMPDNVMQTEDIVFKNVNYDVVWN